MKPAGKFMNDTKLDQETKIETEDDLIILVITKLPNNWKRLNFLECQEITNLPAKEKKKQVSFSF